MARRPYEREIQNTAALPLPGSTSGSGGGGGILSLHESVDDGAYEPFPTSAGAGSDYSPGSQKIGVTGEVVRYSDSAGAERRDAAEYMGELEDEVEMLRAEVERLRVQAAAASNDPDRNELLDYIKTMEPENLRDLTNNTGPDVLEAMNEFIKRILGTDDTSELASTTAEVTNVELSKMVYWLMVVGYSLRTMEVKFEMESTLTFPTTTNTTRTEGGGGGGRKLPPG